MHSQNATVHHRRPELRPVESGSVTGVDRIDFVRVDTQDKITAPRVGGLYELRLTCRVDS
jgi:hypothetical protein